MSKKTNGSYKQIGLQTKSRSRITNTHGLLPSVDGRSTWAKRFRTILYHHVDDIGGEDAASYAELSLARRASALTVELERLELRFHTNGGASFQELDAYQRTANTLRRLLQSVGLKRRIKDITPDPLEYARQNYPTDDDDADDREAAE